MKTLGIMQSFSKFHYGNDYFVHSFFSITNKDGDKITVKLSSPIIRKFNTEKERDEFFLKIENIIEPYEKREEIDQQAWDFATQAREVKAEIVAYNSEWKSEDGRWKE